MSASEMLASENPCTGEIVWQGAVSTAADIDRMVAAALPAANRWRLCPFAERAAQLMAYKAYLAEHKLALADIIARETGKPLWEAVTEATSVIAKIDISIAAYGQRTGDMTAQTPVAQQQLRHQPHGILAVLGPYNFPAHLPNGHNVPALLAGNAVIFKPSELTPASGQFLVTTWADSGGDPDLLQLAIGGRETGVALTAHADIAGVLFTGSVHTGLALHRQFAGHPEKMLALEMGGNNPLIVWDSADRAAAIGVVLQSAFASAGQRCTCARRLILPDTAWGHGFADALADRAQQLPVGAPFDQPPPFMGPVISNAAADQLIAAQADARVRGGKILLPLARPQSDRPYLTPGIIDMSHATDIPDTEYFGPLLQLYFVADFSAALARANATQFGLAAGLISDDAHLWIAFQNSIRAGIVNWNQPLTGASSAAPFGGIGLSGNHRPSAYYAADYCAYPVASLWQERVVMPANIPGLSSGN